MSELQQIELFKEKLKQEEMVYLTIKLPRGLRKMMNMHIATRENLTQSELMQYALQMYLSNFI